MKYAWQQKEWGSFEYDASHFTNQHEEFLKLSGQIIGIYAGLNQDEREEIKIDYLSDEALKTAEIEGEILDHDSVQSSIRRYFELKNPLNKQFVRENGIAKMMVDLYSNYSQPLSHDILFKWHEMLMNGRVDIDNIGGYRSHDEPMQIISNRLDKAVVHYEAPPSKIIKDEMEKFITWYNNSQIQYPIIKAGIAHLYFELIHPFEDGNGRIGRAIIEKSLASYLGKPSYIAISQIISDNRKAYYQALKRANSTHEINDWLVYFCDMVISAQKYTIDSIGFIIAKRKFYQENQDKLNPRQHKLIAKIFDQKLKGFDGGVSTKNYIAITGTSPTTANRDLADLVEKGLFYKTGNLKSTRYWFIKNHQAT